MSTCPANPPPPAGYKVWQGAVPTVLTQWAMGLRDHIAGPPYGTTWTMVYNGQTVLARKDYHSWTYKGGQLVTGICIPGITLYSHVTPGSSLVASSGSGGGDPLAAPDPSIAGALFDADDNLDPSAGINWSLVGLSGATLAVVVAAFWLALRYAGR